MWELVTFVMRAGSALGILAFGAVMVALVMNPLSDSDTREGL